MKFAAMAVEPAQTSEDTVLGGRLILRQPAKGHRVGHDAILLAAASAANPGEHLVDLGSGVGAAGLAVARRVADLLVTLVEIDPGLAALARENAARNDLAARVRAVCLDVAASPAAFTAAGLASGSADNVVMNPPFNPAQNPSPHPARRLAHNPSHDMLHQWLCTASRLLRPAGAITLIWRADRLDSVLAALRPNFGGIVVLPVHAKPGAPAIRVLIGATKASRAPLSLLPGFILAGAGVGLVNPALASTAVGVVAPQRSGMASGINSTFRQVGIATGIAVLGAIFESVISSKLTSHLTGTPAAGQSSQLAHAIAAGGAPQVLHGIPVGQRAQAALAIHSAFTSAMNDILLVAGIVALTGALLGLVLVRGSDFVTHGAPEPAAAAA